MQAKASFGCRELLSVRKGLRPKRGKRRFGRLAGQMLLTLYESVWERDSRCCFFCGRPIPWGTIPHHEQPKGQGGKDRMEDLVMLCQDAAVNPCHYRRHNGPDSREIRQFCMTYLLECYPDTK